MTRSADGTLGVALAVLLATASCSSAVSPKSVTNTNASSPGLVAPVPSNVDLSVMNVTATSSTNTWALFRQDLVGPALTPEHVAYTADGGAHWVDRTPPVASGDEIAGSVFIDDQNAWVATKPERTGCPCVLTPGTVTVFRTSSRGQTWTATQFSAPMPAPLYLAALNPTVGWVGVSVGGSPNVGQGGTVLYATTDGGASFAPVGQGTADDQVIPQRVDHRIPQPILG
jgi:hypothetical protein